MSRRQSTNTTTIHGAFREQVHRTPNLPATRKDDWRLTYSELDRLSNSLGAELQRLGARHGDVIAVCCERSPLLAAAFLAVLKAGGVYLPLDLTHPQDRLNYMLLDSGAAFIIGDSGSLSVVAPRGQTLVPISASERYYADASPKDAARPDSLAYLLYTSGSTGFPKAVEIEHAGIVNVAAAQTIVFGVERGWRVLQFSSPIFDASIFEFILALLHGGELCFASPNEMVLGPPLIQLLRQQAISSLTITPSALRLLPVEEVPTLKMLAVAGEACSAGLVRAWSRVAPFFNLYGPTEASIWATAARCDSNDIEPSIGHPICNVSAVVIDEDGNELFGEGEGELYLGGVGLARGYRNRADLTEERFITGPTGERFFRTGDRVRVRADKSLVFLGRIDDQVKVRGFRIEPGEVERVLLEHRNVSEAAVAAVGTVDDRRYLAAFWAGHHGADLGPAKLRAYLAKRLPEYMIPARFIRLETFPRTPSGKIDRQRLGELTRGEQEDVARAPVVDPVEQRLTDAVANILDVSVLGLDVDFLDVGADSLSFVEIATYVAEEFKLNMYDAIELVSEHRTVRALARQLCNRGAELYP